MLLRCKKRPGTKSATSSDTSNTKPKRIKAELPPSATVAICSQSTNSSTTPPHINIAHSEKKPVNSMDENKAFPIDLPNFDFRVDKITDATVTLDGRRTKIKIKRQPHTEATRLEAHLMCSFQSSPYAPRYFGWSVDPAGILNIAMESLAMDLYDLRINFGCLDAVNNENQAILVRRLSLSTSCRLAVQCLASLKDLHSLGYVHADVKPSNFMVADLNSNSNCVIRLIDFGLSRQVSKDPPRVIGRLIGTARYASPSVHRHFEPTISDDLISLFYTFCETYVGCLPWQNLEHRDDGFAELLRVKESSTCNMEELARRHLPAPLLKYATCVRNLKVGEKPNYCFLMQCFLECVGNEETVYDWIEK